MYRSKVVDKNLRYKLTLAEKKVIRAEVRKHRNKLKKAIDKQAKNVIDTLERLIGVVNGKS